MRPPPPVAGVLGARASVKPPRPERHHRGVGPAWRTQYPSATCGKRGTAVKAVGLGLAIHRRPLFPAPAPSTAVKTRSAKIVNPIRAGTTRTTWCSSANVAPLLLFRSPAAGRDLYRVGVRQAWREAACRASTQSASPARQGVRRAADLAALRP